MLRSSDRARWPVSAAWSPAAQVNPYSIKLGLVSHSFMQTRVWTYHDDVHVVTSICENARDQRMAIYTKSDYPIKSVTCNSVDKACKKLTMIHCWICSAHCVSIHNRNVKVDACRKRREPITAATVSS
jgi:hypothetical protein